METPTHKISRPGWAAQFLYLLIFGIATLFLQFLTGVYDSEMSHYPDEPAHIVTSLMVRDYITDGHFASPVPFAEAYYVHYPKIALGMWPPVYYCFTALWLLLAGVSPQSFLFWMALQGALLSFFVYKIAEQFFPSRVAVVLGFLLAFNPLVIYSSSLIMVDLMVTIFVLLASFFLWRYFVEEERSDVLWFALVTIVAMLTKANANALVLTPILMLVFTRKFHLLKRVDLYLAGFLVVLFGLPWQIFSFRLLQNTVPVAKPSWSQTFFTAGLYANDLLRNLGFALLLLALVAIAAETRNLFLPLSRRPPHAILRAILLAVTIAVFVFHSIVPTPPDQRYILSLIPVLLIFAALGVEVIVRAPLDSYRGWALGLLAILLFGKFAFAVPHRSQLGFNTIARSVSPASHVVLICSDSMGEGALISSIALREHRLGHIILRGSKVLSENAWFLNTYKPLFPTSGQLQNYLYETVDSIVIDNSETLWAQDREALQQCIRENPQRWRMVAKVRDNRSLELYDRVGPPLEPNRKIRVPMGITLNRDLESTLPLPR